MAQAPEREPVSRQALSAALRLGRASRSASTVRCVCPGRTPRQRGTRLGNQSQRAAANVADTQECVAEEPVAMVQGME